MLDSNLIVSSSGSLTLSGSISDGGLAKGLTLDGGGELILAGTGSYTGGTMVNAGTLLVTNSLAIPDSTSLTVAAGGTLIFDPAARGRARYGFARHGRGGSRTGNLGALYGRRLLAAIAAWRRRRNPGGLPMSAPSPSVPFVRIDLLWRFFRRGEHHIRAIVVNVVPEPSTVTLLATGSVGLIGLARRLRFRRCFVP